MTAQLERAEEPDVAPARERDYRAFSVCTEQGRWLSTVADQAAVWLRHQKKWDVDLSTSGSVAHPEGHLAVAVRHHEHGHDRALQLVLEEDNGAGHWTTRVTAAEHDRGGGWVSIDVHSAEGLFVRVPRLARHLAEAIRLQDGQWELRDAPRVVRTGQVGDLLDVLTDADRRGAILVAATDERLDFDAYSSKVATWGREVVGLGHVVVLDPAATAELQDRVGRRWATPAWTIRTYLPGLDLDEHASARQHRILGTERLGRDGDAYLTRLLGGFARTVLARHATPAPLVAWRRTFDRLDNAAIADAMGAMARPSAELAQVQPLPPQVDRIEPTSDGPAVVEEATAFLEELDRIRLVLGLSDLSDDALREVAARAAEPRIDRSALERATRRIEQLQEERDDLQEQLDAVKEELLGEQLDHMETREDSERHADRAVWLGKELAAAGRHDVAYAPTPDDAVAQRPGSFQDLVLAARELSVQGVVLTADERTVCDLDAIDSTGTACRTAWDALLALADFARARQAGDCEGNVHHYLQNTPSGYRGMSPKKHSWTETAATMNQFGDEREFPVPAEVDPTCRTTMRAHFKLARIGMASPRLYYLDDFATTGNIYVGYIGPHKRNTQTN